jgi:hypothetical protein
MTEATASGFYERQRVRRLTGAENGAALVWYRPLVEQVRDERRRRLW